VNDETKDLVNWDERLAVQATDAAASERPAVSKISLRAGVMSYMDSPIPDNNLDCIVLASCIEHVWYDSDFDPDVITPPACFALASLGTGDSAIVPHEVVPSPVHENCGGCPKFEWGSGKGRGKACSSRRRLALIPATALDNPDTIAAAEIAVLGVPVTSVKKWGTYVNVLSSSFQRPPWAMVTNISAAPHPKTMFTVNFKAVRKVESEVLAALEQSIDNATNIIFQPFDMTVSSEDDTDVPAKGKKRKY